jgi:CheY-like chemotaxis protein
MNVGSCAYDHASIKAMIESHFDAAVLEAHSAEDALRLLRTERIHLVLVSRRMDRDQTDGIEIIKQITATPDLAATQTMLITNYPEYQEKAVEAGAQRGFGKADLNAAAAIDVLERALG